jgi:hypothetical protein
MAVTLVTTRDTASSRLFIRRQKPSSPDGQARFRARAAAMLKLVERADISTGPDATKAAN